MDLSRRAALGLLGSAGALSGCVSAGARADVPASFRHGVASGDPAADGAILWTRATPDDPAAAAVSLRWYVAEAPDARPVARGDAEARAARDFTAKVDVRGLRPGRDYHYWFETAAGTRSPVGRLRTLPVGRTDDLVLAVASCALHPGGLFNAYRAIADQPRVDAIVHLGDYIYEYGETGYGAEIGRRLGRLPDPPHEIVSLADYRRRHAQYKSDPDLQALHARAAMIAVWDDHETTNDSWTDGAQNHDPATEGDWPARKRAALQAYFEWMPIRDPAPGRAAEAINRRFDFGDLATLLMVETRLLARSFQAEFKGETRGADDAAAVLAERNRPDRELLGEEQRRWVAGALTDSVRDGRPWQVIGNQVVMARVAGPLFDQFLGADAYRAALAELTPSLRKRVEDSQRSYRAGLPVNLDSWDGYPAARERLYASFRTAGSAPIVLSGDSHAFWANNLRDEAGRAVGCEFGATAITSPSLGDVLRAFRLGEALAAANDEVLATDQAAKGFLLLTLTPELARGDWIAVSTVLAKPFETRVLARFERRRDAAELQRAS